MRPRPQDSDTIAERAAEWYCELPTATLEQRAQFSAWLKESPRHVDEFLCITAVNRALDETPLVLAGIDIAAELASAGAVVSLPVATTATDQEPYTVGARRGTWATVAASILVVVAAASGWLLMRSPDKHHIYSTNIGEQRVIELTDGSLIHLNTQSRIEVDFDATSRTIHLLAGEALFKVTRNPTRPFDVTAGETVIRVLGTEFNVYKRATGTSIAVVEGQVRVFAQDAPPISAGASPGEGANGTGNSERRSARVLSTGDRLEIKPAGMIDASTSADVAQAIAWEQRRLDFRDETLEQIANEFNRYNRTPQIRVEGNAASQKHVTGVFDADDPDSLVQFLSRDPELSVTSRDGDILIQSR